MPSTQRFQSRLFQSLQSKLYQLQDDIQLRWRKLKVTAVWNAQLTLYPLQAAFRAGRWFRQVLQSIETQVSTLGIGAGGKAVQTDRPIQNVLAALNAQSFLEPLLKTKIPLSRPSNIASLDSKERSVQPYRALWHGSRSSKNALDYGKPGAV
jgi:hypothetical protein